MLSRSKWQIFAILFSLLGLGSARTGAQGAWYFLSGTSTEDTEKHYPSFLYTSDTRNKLRVVRQIVAGEHGVHSIHTYETVAFVAYPHLPPSSVSVVHLDTPNLADDILFNPKGDVVIDDRLAMAEPREHDVKELMWLVPPGNIPGGTVLSLAANVSGKGERILRDAWSEYSSLRFQGYPGGPVAASALLGAFEGDSIGIKFSNKYVVVDTIPRSISPSARRETPYYLVVSDAYLAFGILHSLADLQSGALSKQTTETIYLHDRRANRWSTMTLEGTCSRRRIFGPWLASIVQYWNPNHAPNPGASNERNVETDTLPNVRELYTVFAGQKCSIPGDLALRNLRTGQTIAFHTGQEDSEILRVEGETVLYRVNDTIYQAKIGGDQLKDATVVVKDEDVPEIHWAFWSK